MTDRTIRGVDHIGLTLRNIKEAACFFIDGLGAELLYETLNRSIPPFEGPQTEHMMQGPPGLKVSRIRMYKMGYGPGIEPFEYDDVEGQREALRGCDIGWQHMALYADDIQAALG